MTDPSPTAEKVGRTGWFHNDSCFETQVWLDGRCIAGIADGAPREAFVSWGLRVVRSLPIEDVVRIYGASPTTRKETP